MKTRLLEVRNGNTGIGAIGTGTEMMTMMDIEASEGATVTTTMMIAGLAGTVPTGTGGTAHDRGLHRGPGLHLPDGRTIAGPSRTEAETIVHHDPALRHHGEETVMMTARTEEDHTPARGVQSPIRGHDPAHALHTNAAKRGRNETSADDLHLPPILAAVATSHTVHRLKRT